MRLLAFAVVGLAVGCGSVLNSPDGGGGAGGSSAGSGGGGAGNAGNGGTTGGGGTTGSGGTGGGAPCVRNGMSYPSGTTVPSGDNCNSCFCHDGQIACTAVFCPPIDAGTCAFDTTYTYGDTGGFSAWEDTVTLKPAASYTYARNSRITDPPSSSCAPAMPACGTLDLYSPADIMNAIADTDVQKALAMATPPTYGRDSRPVDGTIFQFLRADGRGFLAGGACNASDPLPGPGCVAVPAGVARLVSALRALDEQQLRDPSCAALRR